jgi:hypothetical protein
VLALPCLYFLCYVLVHIMQVVFLEARTRDYSVLFTRCFLDKYHPSLLSALTVGLCSSLLMLSLATAMRFRIGELAIAAPGSLFRLFAIFLVGQTLILIAGHGAIFAAALSAVDVPQPSDLLSGVETVVFITVFIAVACLWMLEFYMNRIYTMLKDIFPRRAQSGQNHTRILAALAAFSLVLLLIKAFVPRLRFEPLTVSGMIAIFEGIVFIATIYVATKRDHP